MQRTRYRSVVLTAAAAVGGALLASIVDRPAATPALAQPAPAAALRWQVVTVERSQREEPERIIRDAVLVDGVLGDTWILTKARGQDTEWVRVPKQKER